LIELIDQSINQKYNLYYNIHNISEKFQYIPLTKIKNQIFKQNSKYYFATALI